MASIPVIDFTPLSLDIDDDKLDLNAVKATSQLMIDAFTDVGFVYLRHTGFPTELLRRVENAAQQFFDLPVDVKRQYTYGGKEMHGWIALEQERSCSELPGDLHENFDMNLKALHDDTKWPKEVPKFKTIMMESFKTLSVLAQRVLMAIANGLELKDVHYLNKCHNTFSRPGVTNMRVMWYPPVTSETKPNQARIGEHTDYGTLTLLFQSPNGGLQIQRRDGEWINAVPIKDTIVVNIGDLMQRWTSNRLISTVHRVLIPETKKKRLMTRRSLVFFLHPDPDVVVRCLDGSDTYKPITDNEYFQTKERETLLYQST